MIGAVRQIDDDRVVAIDFHAKGTVGTLICELTSRHGNMFWIGSDGLIAESFYPDPSHKRLLCVWEALRGAVSKSEYGRETLQI